MRGTILPLLGAMAAACGGDELGVTTRGSGVARIASVDLVGQLTGQPSINNTGAVNVYGTDLGSMFLHDDGNVYFLFGDTFGPPGPPASSGDWRSNTMAYSSDADPGDGISFDGWIVDESDDARALIEGDHAANDGNGEVTKIPTCGYSYGGRQFLWFMSVSQWLDPGEWTVNFAELAYSDDDGGSFTRSGLTRAPTSNFIQLAVAEEGDWLYLWGIPAGRFGGVALARVDPADLLVPSAYQYYAGGDWSADEADAIEVLSPPVGELSVFYDQFVDRWLMTYLDESAGAILLREATEPWGPWSSPWVLATGADYPALYGAYTHPRFTDNDGEGFYFLMSQWGPYNVFLMKASLEGNPVADDGGAGDDGISPDSQGDPDDPGEGGCCRSSTGGERLDLSAAALLLLLLRRRSRRRSSQPG